MKPGLSGGRGRATVEGALVSDCAERDHAREAGPPRQQVSGLWIGGRIGAKIGVVLSLASARRVFQKHQQRVGELFERGADRRACLHGISQTASKPARSLRKRVVVNLTWWPELPISLSSYRSPVLSGLWTLGAHCPFARS